MGFNQERKYLVRARVQLKAVTAQHRLSYLRQLEKQTDTVESNTLKHSNIYDQYRELELFHLSLSYKTFTTSATSTGTVFLLPVGRAVIPIKTYDIDLGSPIMNEYSHDFDSDSPSPVADIEGATYLKKQLGCQRGPFLLQQHNLLIKRFQSVQHQSVTGFSANWYYFPTKSSLHTERLSLCSRKYPKKWYYVLSQL